MATKKCSLPSVPKLSFGETRTGMVPQPGKKISKKASKDGCFSSLRRMYKDEEEPGESRCEVTHSLETAVRKISRSSPNRNQDLGGGIRAGLAILARGYEQYREGIQLLRPTEFGEASSDDLSSEWESSDVDMTPGCRLEGRQRFTLPLVSPDRPMARQRGQRGGLAAWRKVRSAVQWTPFIQQFKAQRYPWVQLAGHSGNFRPGQTQGTVLKKLCASEECIYKRLMKDESLREFVPKFYKSIIMDDDDQFIELEDCLSNFNSPSIMDCKIGIRTYLEEELAKAREKPKLRKDMYEKMVAVDPEAPTAQEHLLKGVTKPRYMVWRETISSTATLGFRLEGVKKSDGTSSKDFKTTKTKDQVSEAFKNFTSRNSDTVKQYLERLKAIKNALEQSEFFRTHELIGSSLLFVHDATKANVWLIDFGKTVPAPNGITIDHKSPWEVGNHEDGYLIGVQNLINIFSDLAVELSATSKTPSTSSDEHTKVTKSSSH